VTRSRCACGLTPIARVGQAYNEEAFRYVLERERRCAERYGHSLLILLVNVKRQAGWRGRMPGEAAAGIFCGLWSCVRDVDCVGWFREDRVAGVILTQACGTLASDIPNRLGQRAARVLMDHLAPDIASRLQVRVLQLKPPKKRHHS
jgi:hypothetical protein